MAYLFNLPILVVHKKKVGDFYYTSMLFKYGLFLSSMVQGVKIHLDETVLDEILDVPVKRIRSIKDKASSLEFVQELSKTTEKPKVGMLKK